MRTDRKIIVITGVTSEGLGNAMAREFLDFGHTVVGCGRRISKIDQLKTEFSFIADRCHFSVVDVTHDKCVKMWAQTVLEKFGPPDYLINNAAIFPNMESMVETTAEDFDKVIDINVKGVANVTRHFVPSMIEAKRGAIVNVTSCAGRNPFPRFGAYATSKWALEGFSRTLAAELPEPLMSFQLDPGTVRTSLPMDIFGKEFHAKQIAAGEWAKAVCPKLLKLDRSMNGKIWDTTELGLKNAIYVDENGKLNPCFASELKEYRLNDNSCNNIDG